ncbi:ABC-type transport auxiliary lipoprotein family protein [Endothiovibrio diazotrophicus]
MRRIALLLATVATLAGCGSAPPVPENRFYRLPVEAPVALAAPAVPGVLAVGTIHSDGLHAERPVLYAEAGRSAELTQYHYHAWADAPPLLIQESLLLHLRSARAAPLVVTDDARADWDYRLYGRLRRFERLLDEAGGSRVVAELELGLESRDGRQPLLLKDYRAEEPVAEDSLDATAGAFSRALGRIYRDLTEDLAATTYPK